MGQYRADERSQQWDARRFGNVITAEECRGAVGQHAGDDRNGQPEQTDPAIRIDSRSAPYCESDADHCTGNREGSRDWVASVYAEPDVRSGG